MSKHVTDISSTLKHMKFMSNAQSIKESQNKQVEREESQNWKTNGHIKADTMDVQLSLFKYTKIIGRRSFQNFNPQIEEIAEIIEKEYRLNDSIEVEDRDGVDELKMVERMDENIKNDLNDNINETHAFGSISNFNNLKRKSKSIEKRKKSKK